jgi:hypothetical protein
VARGARARAKKPGVVRENRVDPAEKNARVSGTTSAGTEETTAPDSAAAADDFTLEGTRPGERIPQDGEPGSATFAGKRARAPMGTLPLIDVEKFIRNDKDFDSLMIEHAERVPQIAFGLLELKQRTGVPTAIAAATENWGQATKTAAAVRERFLDLQERTRALIQLDQVMDIVGTELQACARSSTNSATRSARRESRRPRARRLRHQRRDRQGIYERMEQVESRSRARNSRHDARGRRRLSALLPLAFPPRERLKPSRWCEKYIRLPAGKQETEPGEVRFDKRPYLREPIDCAADPAVSDIVFVGPTRIGKTFFLRMGLCWTIAGDPAPWMWVDSTEDKAKDVSKKELQPMIAANAILRDRKPKNRHNFTDLRMLFPAAAGAMVGGNSDAQVAGDTVKRIFGNELDKWRGATDKEASIAELVRHRTESFNEERRHFWSSTPTLEEMQTWQYAMRGDQRKWECVCPRCGRSNFSSGKMSTGTRPPKNPPANGICISSRRRRATPALIIVCSAHDKGGAEWTGAGWTEDERMAAICDPRAQWVPTAVGEPGWRSYLINGLYGPLDSNSSRAARRRLSLREIARLLFRPSGFLEFPHGPALARQRLPGHDGEVRRPRGGPASGLGAKESYFRGSVPDWFHPRLFIVGFDVQANRLPFVVRAFDWSGRSFLVDHGEVASWADLEQIQEDYRKTLNCSSYVIGDINYEERRAETLEQIYFRKDRGWFGAEAFELAKQLVTLDQANVYAGGKLAGKTERDGHFISKFVISAYEFKVELEKRFTGEIPNWFCYQLPLAATEQEIEEQAAYYKQLLDERRVPRRVRIAGKPPFEWRSKNKFNHAFDCEVYISPSSGRCRNAAAPPRARRPRNARKRPPAAPACRSTARTR